MDDSSKHHPGTVLVTGGSRGIGAAISRKLAGEGWLSELSGIIGRTSGVTLQQVLRGFFHATNYLKIDVAESKAADLMIDALETALLDDLPEVREAAVWPLAWTRHERTPIVLRQAYYREQDSNVKAQMVRVVTSLMNQNGRRAMMSITSCNRSPRSSHCEPISKFVSDSSKRAIGSAYISS